jgi:hypothetical protein
MTEIMNAPGTHHPFPRSNPWPPPVGQTGNGNIPIGRGVKKLYTSVIAALRYAFGLAGTNGVAFGGSDRKQPEDTSGGYDRRRGAGEAAAIPIDCSDVVIVSSEGCDRIR